MFPQDGYAVYFPGGKSTVSYSTRHLSIMGKIAKSIRGLVGQQNI